MDLDLVRGPLSEVRAVVFDTDGVLLDSARVHASAWKEAFDAFLQAAGPPGDTPAVPFRPFSADDYRLRVDGKSRLDGAAAFLASRGIELPAGMPDDPPGDRTVAAIAARKEELLVDRLRTHGVEVWPGTPRLLRALARSEIPCAAVSASRHARELLTTAGLMGLLGTVVDGGEAALLHLPGKPDPALFLEAASRLGVPPERSAVVEDALAGVEAGRRGGFRPVVGVDRTAGPISSSDLRAHGADLVVRDLAELLDGTPEED
ncbi:HAD family hydrolase [Streptomyces iconiensis]|uniref:HAD-IA family hydrolase n=1 Tax=Streptomyces iconiensis TaxID=1384038 RepID=A0ABT7A352_9ACTN|nr:HAD-IA family hydrolase [Streptomyces iconiensis]MDJ1135492.1 HAD-IA family hydrolase [Streptomyces iconiensis]